MDTKDRRSKYVAAVVLIAFCCISVTSAYMNGTTQQGDNATGCGPVPFLEHGEILLLNKTNSSFGDTADVTCDQGYAASARNISCLETMEWENVTCVIHGCGPVPFLEHGEILLLNKTSSSFGDTADVKCDQGYAASARNISCLETMEWENVTCDVHGCGPVPFLQHGEIVLLNKTNSSFGDTADVTCDQGYAASARNISCLQTMEWENVTCDVHGCGPVPFLEHGEILLLNKTNSSFGDTAEVTCDQGYAASTQNISCLETMEWENVTCDVHGCGPVPFLEHGEILLLNTTNSSFGDTADVTCDQGYAASAQNIKCLETMEWGNVSCDVHGCGPVPFLEHGEILLSNKTNSSFGDTADVTCDQGYAASAQNISCLETMEWENVTCYVHGCGPVPFLEHGEILLLNKINSSFGVTAEVTCDQGYAASARNISCLETMEWENVTCDVHGCGPVPFLEHGEILFLNKTNSSFGDTAEVTCDQGYAASAQNISCLETMEWENVTCDVQGCGPVPFLEHGEILLLNTNNSSLGDTAEVTCDQGYAASAQNISCLETMEWENVTCDIHGCGPLPFLEHGEILLLNKTNSSFGDTADVTCDQGYAASAQNISCLETMEWENVTCVIHGCGPVPFLEHGEILLLNKTNSSFGDTAVVTCDHGYASSAQNISCLETMEWENVTCDVHGCGPVPFLEHGEILLLNKTNSSFGDTADVTCDQGYAASAQNISCLETMEWENVTCVIHGCGPVPFLEHGEILLLNKTNSSFGDTADVTCDQGYAASAQNISCLETMEWENVTCDVHGCGPVPFLEHGEILLLNKTNSSFGDTAEVTCDQGYAASAQNISCLETMEWENVTCDVHGCGPVPFLEHGEILLLNKTNSSFGDTADVTCDQGYAASAQNISCLETMEWENVTCDIHGCGLVLFLEHGEILLLNKTNSSFGDTAEVTCDQGYAASAQNIICLETMEWENVTCDVHGCGPVPFLEHGEILLLNKTNSSFGDTADVTCDQGYAASAQNISCLETMEWENVTCDIHGCGPVPFLEHGEILLLNTTNSSFGDTAEVTCDQGYAASAQNISCLETMEWENVTCDVHGCGPVPFLEHGEILLLNKTNSSFGDTSVVTCDQGYAASAQNISCLETMEWENVTCDIHGCGPVPFLEHGEILLLNKTNSSFGDTADVTCDQGYAASAQNISCLETMEWENVTCDIHGCGPVPFLEHGEILLLNTTNSSFGDTAEVTCDQGYAASAQNISCLETMEWENVTCDVHGCGPVPFLEHGEILLLNKTNSSFGDTADVTCDQGYAASAQNISCLETMEWENVTCVIHGCGPVPFLEHGEILLLNTTNSSFGDTAEVTCDQRYAASAQNISCLETMEWENVTCDVHGCGPVPFLEHGEILLLNKTNSSFGDTADVTCDQGYAASAQNISCLETMEWENVTCDIHGCGPVPFLEHGEILLLNTTNSSFGDTAEVTCDQGYAASAQNVSCLETMEWENVTCDVHGCGPVPFLEHGEILLLNKTNSSFGDTADVTCDQGYAASAQNISCLETMEWENVTCVIHGCGPVPFLEHGEILLLNKTNSSFGDTAEVTCDQGYAASAQNISCLETMEWENVTCDVHGCGPVPFLEHGEILLLNKTNSSFGDTADVTCDQGYAASAQNISCLETMEWENVTCVIHSCGPVPFLEHGEILLLNKTNSSFGDTAEVTCDQGYAASAQNISCLETMEWENVTCDVHGCGPVPFLEHGEILLLNKTNSSFGDTADVTCDQGYAASAQNISCLETMEWENVTCVIHGCGPVPFLEHGEILLLNKTNSSFGDTAEVTCDQGYAASAQNISCLETMEWENVTCDVHGCGPVPFLEHGEILLLNKTNSSFGDTADVTCDQGYAASAQNISCLETMEWENVTCVIHSCGPVPFLEHGEILLLNKTNSSFGDTAEVTCDQGYAASAQNISCLETMEWENVTCDVHGCGPVPFLEHGEILLLNKTNSSFGDTADVTCDQGYAASAQNISCLETMEWENVTCVIHGCGPVPFLEHGEILLLNKTNSSFGDTAEVTCDQGYAASAQNISCLETMEWENVTCDVHGCGPVPFLEHGEILLLNKTNSSFGDTADVTCDQGYAASAQNISCLETMEWENVTCVIHGCGPVPFLEHGEIQLLNKTNSSFGDTAEVTCDQGYAASAQNISCLETMEWENVTCDVHGCGPVPFLEHGEILLLNKNNSSFGDTADVTCDQGYAASAQNISCLETMEWENVTCVIHGCGPVPFLEHGEILLLNTTNSSFGDTAEVTCDQGYAASAQNIICLETMEWENVTCDVHGCGPVPFLEHGEILLLNKTNSSFGDTADVTCDQGYAASAQNISCLETMEWENVTCVIHGCGPVPFLEHGEILLLNKTNSSFGDTAEVTCDQGYAASAQNISCLETMEWENVTCDVHGCGPVPFLEHGEILLLNKTNSSFGDTADVTCDQGYAASAQNISCLETMEWENVTCVIHGCGPVPFLEHGEILLLNKTNSSFGDTAEVTCDQGYAASAQNISCLETMEWENVTCDVHGCGPVPFLEHGEILLLNKTNSSFGDTADVTCDQGYAASAQNISCLETMEWENVTCVIHGCGPVPFLEHGEILLLNKTNSSFGDTAEVTCDQGYAASAQNISCLETMEWENVTCDVHGCGPVPFLEHGEILLLNKTNSSFGDTADVTCDQGYAASAQNISCLETMEWENVTCVIHGCGPVPFLEHGEILLLNKTNSSFGDTAEVTCDQGYAASAQNISCLETMEWENVTCDVHGCGPVPFLEHGEILLLNKTNSSFGDTADVTCDQGYAASAQNISCLETMEWENVTCVIHGCGPVPFLEHGEIRLLNKTNSSFGDTADVTCDQGYTASAQNISCLETMEWENVTCDVHGCGPVPFLEHGEILLLNKTNSSFGDTADVMCDQGYAASAQNISCLETMEWENVTCDVHGCGPVPFLEHGEILLLNKTNSSFGDTADVTCDQGYAASAQNISCLETMVWENVTCDVHDCGEVPSLDHGMFLLADTTNTSVGAKAFIQCNLGYSPDKQHVTCLPSGIWESNVSCVLRVCEASTAPDVENGIVTVDAYNTTIASYANVTCNDGFAATAPIILCMGEGIWQNNVSCVRFGLGTIKVESGQEISDNHQRSFLRCSFTVAYGLKYNIEWHVNNEAIYNTGLMSSSQPEAFVLSDEMFTANINDNILSQLFGTKVTCSVTVFDGVGDMVHENGTSPEFTLIQVSTTSIEMLRGKEETFTVFLNIPFGCSADTEDCFLQYILYDEDDTYNCYDSTIAAVGKDTCGGKVEGATQGTTTSTYTNITITTKNNRWYRLRWYFYLVLKLVAVGNSKLIWNMPSTRITVRVMENDDTRYRGCYSYVDPYMYTFDRRWYSMQLIEEFVLLRHKSLPIEIQTVTAYCGWGATCSCAVTVRAGGDVFTVNHCHGHHTGYLSAKDGILKVYRTWSTSYLIVLPTGMQVYVYAMPYLYYMMNVYVTPTPSDFEQLEGLCGNFNGDFSDDTLLRDTNTMSSVETSRIYWGWWWWWLSRYFYPHDFAYSWGLFRTGRSDESLLNPDVYENVESWPDDKKLCVCPYAKDNNYQSFCSANEESTCLSPVWRYGTLIGVSSRSKREVYGSEERVSLSKAHVAKKMIKMKKRWTELNQEHSQRRKKRQVENDTVEFNETAISYEEALQICEDQLTKCYGYANKENVSEVSNSTDNLDNCARDTMRENTTDWIESHCDTINQEVTVELEKDVEFAENNTELTEGMKNNSCPGKCSGNGQCIAGECVCDPDFATDLCLLNITASPLLEELANDGVCDVNDDPCDYIVIVGDGFIEQAVCNITVYGAGQDGIFILTEQFETNCTYLNYNELLAPTLTDTSNATTNATANATDIARMVGISVSNDGSHFSTVQHAVILDTTCQQSGTNQNNETIVTLKTGYCFIEGTCYTSGSYMSSSTCLKCDTSTDFFYWTNGCDESDKSEESYLIIVLASVGGVVVVGAISVALSVYFYMKAKTASAVVPLVDMSLGPSRMKFWLKKGSTVSVVEHHLEEGRGAKAAAKV